MTKIKKAFELLSGQHREAGKVYEKGAVVVSESELDVLFINKFNKLPIDPADVENIEQESASASKLPDDIIEHDENETDEYPMAVEKGVLVLRKASWYSIVDLDEPTEAMNEKGLRKDDVPAFLESIVIED